MVGFLPFFDRTVMARKLAKSTVDRFRKRLVGERNHLQELVDEYEREIKIARMTESSSDRSPEPGNAEASSMKLEYAKELSIEQNTLDLIGKIDHALARIDAGEYGICESCGKAIPIERLNVLPYATLCVEDAAKTR